MSDRLRFTGPHVRDTDSELETRTLRPTLDDPIREHEGGAIAFPVAVGVIVVSIAFGWLCGKASRPDSAAANQETTTPYQEQQQHDYHR